MLLVLAVLVMYVRPDYFSLTISACLMIVLSKEPVDTLYLKFIVLGLLISLFVDLIWFALYTEH